MNMHQQGGVANGSVKLNAGIDVSKLHFDVCLEARSYLMHAMQQETVLGEIDSNKHNGHGHPLPRGVS